MKSLTRKAALLSLLIFSVSAAQGFAKHHSDYKATLEEFQHAGASASFFKNSYAYAVFPTVGAGAIGVGGAHGSGRVYVHDAYVGNVTLNQVSVGLQAGGEAYSEIVFFEDERSFKEFQAGTYQLAADASAVVITSAANATVATDQKSAGLSGGEHDATTRGSYTRGVAIFTIAKGGLMVAAAVAGQKFTYKPLKATQTQQ